MATLAGWVAKKACVRKRACSKHMGKKLMKEAEGSSKKGSSGSKGSSKKGKGSGSSSGADKAKRAAREFLK